MGESDDEAPVPRRRPAKPEARAVELCRQAAEQGDARAQGRLGLMYAVGRGGLAKDEARAVELWRQAAEQGDADAQFHLGFMYEAGRGGLAKDEAKAVELWRQAAEQGDAQAQFRLGVMYEAGRGGLAKDEVRAAELWRQAAEQGEARAQFRLGVMYEAGRGGLAKDEARAVELWRQAAEQGKARAQFRLGVMYEVGRGGLATDKVRALELLTKALQDERVRPNAQRVLSRLRLSFEDISSELPEAQRVRLRSQPGWQYRPSDDAASEVSGAPSEVALLADLDEFGLQGSDDPMTRRLAGFCDAQLRLSCDHEELRMACDEERQRRQRAEAQLELLHNGFQEPLALPPPPPAAYLVPKPRSEPYSGPGLRPLSRARFLYHATRWETLAAMRSMSPIPKLEPQAPGPRSEKYDGVLSAISAGSSSSSGSFEVIFFHTQDWSHNGTPYPEAYAESEFGAKAKYVPVLAITPDNALGERYDYGVFLLSDRHITIGHTDKRLLKVVIAARGGGPLCLAGILDKEASGEQTGQRRTLHLGDVGPGYAASNIAEYKVDRDVFFQLSFVQNQWELKVPDMADAAGQYCALDIALALPVGVRRASLPLSLFDGGGALPPDVPPDGSPPPGHTRKRTGSGATRVWKHRPAPTSAGGIQLPPPAHSA
ncbi:hypothetical protein EMIHUDRAFT_119510 [Emiliania huxleyi CCMP1516]|uniref:Uncharacterized protein n=2 Tax=Emiliania huxleyi TaxID=2903 RepID=A0A0D3IV00_EMIH1|nr:hypothetical protein EMIHUDRAFT_119510 [Emiliania huxleyi CCMP1516]EOD15085.1 hypothetical protein EMIHUDRAFT_119510 [Emiliania huxleyi CCMP1516]|eukprot:XP_005767514.1 hypothetical protein EMIHUDRAFT_119510 [Emiliania huxleyi CCMP1516]